MHLSSATVRAPAAAALAPGGLLMRGACLRYDHLALPPLVLSGHAASLTPY